MLTVALAILGCSSGRGPATVDGGPKEIDHAQAARMLESGDPPLVLDVRTPKEYAEGHIPGARLVPLNTLADSLGALADFKGEEIIAVCRTGRRSGIATEQLSKAGFDKVYNLKGGMVKWTQNAGKVE